MRKIHILFSLVVIGALWFILSHVTAGITTIVALVFLVALSGILRLFARKYSSLEDTSGELPKNTLLISFSIIAPVILLVSIICCKNTPTVVSVLSVTSALCMIFILSSGQICRNFSWKYVNISMLICMLPMLFSLGRTPKYHMGLYPVIRFYSVVLSFAISFWFILSMNLKKKDSQFLLVPLFLCGMLLTFSLNFLCNKSVGEVHSYTATEITNNNTNCELDDGWHFSYYNCPVEIGENGHVMQYNGWFNIVYLEPTN